MTAAALPVTTLDRWQRRIVVAAWVTYAAYYLGRVNLSTALPDMQATLSLSKSDVGWISTAFFWTYALGQLVNGRLGDRLSPRRMVLVGMLISAGLNLLFSALSAPLSLVAVWAVNGFFQATGWGPILRTLANWLSTAQRTRVSSVFGSSFVVGSAATWLLTGWVVTHLGWRAAFWLPAALMALVAVGWYLAVRDAPDGAAPGTHAPAAARATHGPSGNVWQDLLTKLRRFWLLVLACLLMGFAFAALGVWLPTYYVEVRGLNIGLAASIATLVPLAGIAGTLLIGGLVGRYWVGREAAGLAGVLVALTALFVLYPLLPANLVIGTVAFIFIGLLAYGVTSVLLTTMPLVIGGREDASSAAGLLDLAFNIGAGLSGAVIGGLLDTRGWPAVFVTLAGVTLGAAACLIAPQLIRLRGKA